MVALVTHVADGQPHRLLGGELPGCTHIHQRVARGGILATAREARGHPLLALDQRPVGIQHPLAIQAPVPAQRQAVSRHLEERLVQVVVLAAHHRPACPQPVISHRLPTQAGIGPRQRHVAQVEVLLAGSSIDLAAGRHGRLTGQLHAGDVVVDAAAVDRSRVLQPLVTPLETQLDLSGRLGRDLRAAGIVEAVAARAGLVAFAQVGRTEGARDIQIGTQQRADLVDGPQTGRGGTIAAIQPGGDATVVHGSRLAFHPVMAQAGQHVQRAEMHVVLHVDAQCLHLTVTERIGGRVPGKGGGRGLTAVGVGSHPPQVHACRQQVLRMHLPVGLHVQAIGGKGHVGEGQVTTQPIGVTVDGALHFLTVDAHVQVHRHAARTLQAVAHLIEAPVLTG